MSDSSSDIGAFFAGFVVGGLVGAATALILAPQSGEETRSRIMERSDEWREMGSERLAPVRERAEATLDDLRHRAQETGSEIQERSRIVLSEGKSILPNLNKQLDGQADDEGEEPPDSQ
jgi:gas vesicle protein